MLCKTTFQTSVLSVHEQLCVIVCMKMFQGTDKTKIFSSNDVILQGKNHTKMVSPNDRPFSLQCEIAGSSGFLVGEVQSKVHAHFLKEVHPVPPKRTTYCLL